MRVSPTAVLLLAVFALVAPPVCLAAVLLAAGCHGREALCVLAGPLINGTLSWLLSLAGARREELYIFAGAQLILGVFNLLPLWTLDGGRLLWIAIAWLTDPFLADKVCRVVTAALLLALAALGIGLWVRYRSGFLLVGVVGIICCTGREFMLANQTGRG